MRAKSAASSQATGLRTAMGASRARPVRRGRARRPLGEKQPRGERDHGHRRIDLEGPAPAPQCERERDGDPRRDGGPHLDRGGVDAGGRGAPPGEPLLDQDREGRPGRPDSQAHRDRQHEQPRAVGCQPPERPGQGDQQQAPGERPAGAERGDDRRCGQREDAHAQERDGGQQARLSEAHAEVGPDLGGERPHADQLRPERKGGDREDGHAGRDAASVHGPPLVPGARASTCRAFRSSEERSRCTVS